ncbi:hypothetical protein L6475_00890 [Prevotella sp. E9-3]|uniref:hypothetical protein n=1 Tax=Prevotella sp. E9-3 TaxID=2913621 RepID=UPI001EDADF2F|nr:hypothetical protein [Prevotella sp. E9-3]UKK48552.1 hypothetical protein L6475_00890 [Prevotella sp. E9-3]
MNSFSLRIYILICTTVWWLQTHAQSDDYGASDRGRRGMEEVEEMDEMMDGVEGFNLTFSDILMIVLLVVACYIFGKIWKGCSYLLVLVAVILYFMNH